MKTRKEIENRQTPKRYVTACNLVVDITMKVSINRAVDRFNRQKTSSQKGEKASPYITLARLYGIIVYNP